MGLCLEADYKRPEVERLAGNFCLRPGKHQRSRWGYAVWRLCLSGLIQRCRFSCDHKQPGLAL